MSQKIKHCRHSLNEKKSDGGGGGDGGDEQTGEK